MDSDNSFALAMIAFGLIILLAGCGIAVYRDQEAGKESELDRDLNRLARKITTEFSSGSGALSISMLGSSDIDIADDRSAMIRLETMDGDELVIHIPDEGTFLEMSDSGKGSSMQKNVPVVTDDGRVVPGKLEVTLNG